MKIKQCIILAGGLGSRLGDLTKKTPKPLIKINNLPFLFYLISKLKNEGINNIVILVWNLSDKFKKINFKKIFGINIKLVKEKKKLGTGGCIINAYDFLNKEFFLVNGDTLFNISLKDLEKNFLKRKNTNLITACHFSKKSTNKFVYIFNEKNKLINYKISKKKKNWISGGIYIFKKKVFKNLKKKILDLDREIVYNQFNKKKIFAKKYYNSFIDIGTKSDLKKAKNIVPRIIKKSILI